MDPAADAESNAEKATVTPGPLVPAGELYGALLLEHGMAREALAAYEQASVADAFGRANLEANAEEVVSLNFASWNQIAGWLRQLDGLREAA